ncbi:hypothetical protein SARC_17949 [Sphaeroforma arctica JP610]|uniref:Uncharacterized protein n=1 Tax=Sphaeroforma arctica JP610 TaxID=667725 RepID=A0A0L0EYH9_9EUKA|nr:hypothetical protein SARC_17949 [Sphaeroforma arctica JP610]KNC69537.1 hypothetical protein SARC_17949 [Sphaeroforma arctica JP610]|eukprot:XP_014143439.1 hypothetical protein SARC_17949 [Sphaeroforma arctica JP610]
MSAVKRVSNAEEVNENSPLIRINSEAASTSSTAEHNRNNNKDHNTISKESASRGRRQHRDSIDSQKSASSLTSNSSQSSLTYRDLSPGANAIRYSALSTNDLVTSPSASRRTSNISSTSVASSSSGTRQPFEPVTSSPNLSPDAQHTQVLIQSAFFCMYTL